MARLARLLARVVRHWRAFLGRAPERSRDRDREYNPYKCVQQIHSAVPVDFEGYRAEAGGATELPLDPDSNAHRVLRFLAAQPDLGFKPAEIRDHVEVPAGSLGPTLARLEERGLVEHASPYWSAADDDRLAALDGTAASLRAFEDRHGDDDFEGWHASDLDPRADR